MICFGHIPQFGNSKFTVSLNVVRIPGGYRIGPPKELSVPKFQAVFVDLRELKHTTIGAPRDLAAKTREEALDEAADILAPRRANFIEILHKGKCIAWVPTLQP